MTGSEIREKFLAYFEQQGHQRVASSSLVPWNDPTLLFTNAGMNQFKDVFLGAEQRDYLRATTSQKCVRAGGKHNDLENVGFTARHHTFFEMLGNFSFGDYFKQRAIAFGWELITSPQWFAIPRERLYVTIFGGEGALHRDTEAQQYWREQGVDSDRIFELGMKDNFWAMGETGPCGPCSELHYDMGVLASETGHADCKFPCDCGRYVEIWNLVFMQFERDSAGALNPLPKPSIDTGAGLERLASVLQGKLSNYETDLFVPLIERAGKVITLANGGKQPPLSSLRIIADHSRAATFLIADGVLPANEGRGYVLRKIMRRAIRHARLHGATEPFLAEMVTAVAEQMQDAYPELRDSREKVAGIVTAEEVRFAHTLDLGLKRLEEDFAPLLRQKEANSSAPPPLYPGEKAFKLYDTFGLPLDFIADAARDQGLGFDGEGFDRAMAAQRDLARASWKGGAKASASPAYRELPRTAFEGYEQTALPGCQIIALVRQGAGVQELKTGEEGEVVLDRTPFYADSGGQVGDKGWFYENGTRSLVAQVTGCILPVQGVRAHRVLVARDLRVGDRVDAVVDAAIRQATMRNHTGTHLLHAALREILGKHVKQAGSLVDPGHLRFDFSHFTPVADEELQDIEDLINHEVLGNRKVETLVDVPIDVAVNELKAMALFGEKYGDRVRVVKIGDFSTELCGGIHTSATGEIGLVKLLDESSVSSGVRRVEAVTGAGALGQFRKLQALEEGLRSRVQVGEQDVQGLRGFGGRLVGDYESQIKELKRELDRTRLKSAASAASSAGDQSRMIDGIKVLVHRADNLERAQLRSLMDTLRDRLGSGVVALGSAGTDGKVALMVAVTKDLTGRVQAGKIISAIAARVGGSGGGRPEMAEAGGKDASQLDAALHAVYEVVENLTAAA